MLNTFAVVSTFANGQSAIRTFLHLENAIAECNRIPMDGAVTRRAYNLETEKELLVVHHE